MKKKMPENEDFGGWCFAMLNGKLAEIHFKKKNGESIIWGHCYVKREEFKTKREQRMIDDDTKKVQLTWRKGVYTRVTKKP